MAATKTMQTEAFWRAYVERRKVTGADYAVVAFGDSPSMATELAALVVSGRKRATCSLLRDYADAPATLPKVGDHVVVVDGNGMPRRIWRTTEIEIKPLIAVDDQFAWDEGEGDRSRKWWLEAHRRYFARQAVRDGFEMRDTIEAVFERFEIMWPRLDPGEPMLCPIGECYRDSGSLQAVSGVQCPVRVRSGHQHTSAPCPLRANS